MSLRNPLARVRGLGSAKEGVAHWWMQRLTALALVPLTLWFVAGMAAMTGADYAAVKAWIGSPMTAVLLTLLVGAGIHHGQLGLQVVIEDYVPHTGLRVGAVIIVKFAAILIAASGILAIVSIAVGG